MFWLIPAIGAVAGAVCAVFGIVSVMGPSRRLRAAFERVQTNASAVETAPASRAFARLGRDVNAAKILLDRANQALSEIRGGLADLRLRDAMVALRLARLAFAALTILR